MDNQVLSEIRRVPKVEYARNIGISINTLGRMVNVEFYKDLVACGYRKNQKYLTQKQISVLENKCVNLHLEN